MTMIESLVEKFPVRRSKAQKETFRAWVVEKAQSMGYPAQVESINTFIHEECKLHDKFYGFATMHPDYEHIEAELDRAVEMGLHVFTGTIIGMSIPDTRKPS